MKKITLLLAIAILPLMSFAQDVFEFNNSDDGWNTLLKFTATPMATYLELQTVPGDGTLKNPSIENPALTTPVDATTKFYVGVTLKNVSADGPTFMKFQYRKNDDSGWISKSTAITNGDSDFQTYWIELTNPTHWVGTKDRFRIQFKEDNGSNGGANYVLPTNPVTIQLDKVEFVAMPPTIERNAFEFNTDGDPEGWTEANGTIVGVTGGYLTFAPNADSFAKIILTMYHVDADNHSIMHVTLKNESTDDDGLRVVLTDPSQNITVPITTSDTGFNTYEFDMSTLAGWTGNVTGIKLAFRDEDNPNGAGKSSGTGNFVIDRIWFDNTASVNDNSLVDFGVYPNPVKDVLNISSENTLKEVAIYNITGKQVLTSNQNQISVANLAPGVYVVKITDQDNHQEVAKILITK